MAVRQFNITGVCNPAMHYMVDTGAKIKTIIRDYVDDGRYFVINRARQYGKTTMLSLLEAELKERYIVINTSFERLGKKVFDDDALFIKRFLQLCAEELSNQPLDREVISRWLSADEPFDMFVLGVKMKNLVTDVKRPVVMMIDEVDKSSNNQLFLDFLGLLRDMYLKRISSNAPAFHCVILAGVTDIKNLKMKIRPESEHSQNSPWNIAAPFDVDMSFSPAEIATMLVEYETDHQTGMDIDTVSERLYFHTAGYPYLVSLLCQYIHNGKLSWSIESVDTVATRALKAQITLFDDVIKNLQNHSEFARLVERIVLEGKTVQYNQYDPKIQIGLMYGILVHDDLWVRVANQIFSLLIMNYFISISTTNDLVSDRSIRDASIYIQDGVLDFDVVLERFCVFMDDEYRNQSSTFIEREARRLLIGYIKPIINGKGNYYLEPEIRGGQKIDILVQYGQVEYIIEVKIWRGEAYELKAYDQVAQYVKARHQQIGYVVSFCKLQHATHQNRVFMHRDVEIHEVIVVY